MVAGDSCMQVQPDPHDRMDGGPATREGPNRLRPRRDTFARRAIGNSIYVRNYAKHGFQLGLPQRRARLVMAEADQR